MSVVAAAASRVYGVTKMIILKFEYLPVTNVTLLRQMKENL